MSTVVPGQEYRTVHFALTAGTETTVYTCGDDGETFADVSSISVTASTGTAGTATVTHYRSGVGYVLCYQGSVGANLPLTLTMEPTLSLIIANGTADIIKVTGANLQHVHITMVRGGSRLTGQPG